LRPGGEIEAMKLSLEGGGRGAAVVALVVLAAWLAGGRHLLRAEVRGFSFVPTLASMSTDERAAKVSGPVYALSKVAASLIPERPGDAAIYFFEPGRAADGGYMYHKLKYYLYPRRIRVVYADSRPDPAMFREGDYIVFYALPGWHGTPAWSSLAHRLDVGLLYSRVDGDGSTAVYRVREGAEDGDG